jgi:exopolyphosphatase/pppGpp-phosphohydrolase
VARASVSGFEVIDADSRPVRLGEGVVLNGTLRGDAIDRILGTLEVCAAKIGREQILRIFDKLSVLSVAELTALPCIGDDRAEPALAGGAILEAICRRWPAPMVRVADRGLGEGVLMDLMR